MEKKNPIVTIEMLDGDVMKAELYPEIAPNTVNNFISLIKKGYYNGVIFHRIIKGFMIQGGDPDGLGTGGPGYYIKGEFTSNGFQNDLKHEEGILSMARATPPDTAGSQFFIMLGTAEHLDNNYAAFGKVIDGMEIVKRIEEKEEVADSQSGKLKTNLVLKKAIIDLKGKEYPNVEIIKE